VIVRQIRDLKSQLPDSLWQDLTFFEINTILALRIFDQFNTDVNILEVGLGGRLDCVNVYDPDVSVITSIGLDHQEFLGDSHAAIAREKAGIMRPGKPVVWGGLQFSNQEAHEAILNYALEINAQITIPENIEKPGLPAMLRNNPKFLVRNFCVALAALDQLIASGHCPKLDKDASKFALKHFDDAHLPWPVTLKGRFEQLIVSKEGKSRELLIDVCHNPHGARALSMALEEMQIINDGGKLPCLISVLSDKDASGIWTEIRGKISDVIRFKIPSSRSWDGQDHRIDGPMMESFASAWERALSEGQWQNQSPWLIFGSVAAVGEVFSFFRREGWIVDRKFKD
jgi:dihydrofolate synthase/folylpolyglutamate synthase